MLDGVIHHPLVRKHWSELVALFIMIALFAYMIARRH